ncbi:dihydroneopterin triphosphate diphosphatase [Rodentibacter myodis]|uniref:Dihydroneopterin triphosphate diphosphatase n=1 Tax=Rodentibacter myodis TaxID=1907939 RepID=A0A1V3JJR8_9PAST|nr:dihydroneopterin triphosphate diphosphatase [Rodentibacter myodis]OOF56905.1 dihydroneopterin triphosphate diphosphatase [Rodentibacter myodis]
MNFKNNQSILVVIYSKETNNVLMLQRQDDPDFWQSVTGSIEKGEMPQDAAIRELWEEVRLKISENSTALFDCNECVEFEIFPHFRYKYAPHITHAREHWFLCAVDEEFVPQLAEHLDFKWVSAQEAVKMTKSPNNAEAIRKYLIDDFSLLRGNELKNEK